MNPDTTYCYGCFAGHGLGTLTEELNAADPFALTPAEIVERVLAAGYTPDMQSERLLRFSTLGRIATVKRGGQRFLVAADRGSETIVVQEVRADPYEAAEPFTYGDQPRVSG